ncbi:cyclin-dependent kinase 11B-like isoform X2 [Littorina saxatilis]|uniref:cyclin-dependent kinase 11B-like isoform X2 n=1 Tax=Littorina saxatilis TaxID=31220 RepID=UPI0038B57BC5
MSGSSSSGSGHSPYEQGEVKSSPEHAYNERARQREVIITSERHLSLSPHSQEAMDEDKDAGDVIEIPSDDGEIERDALNIKPPQSQAGPARREKSHKHKHKADRRRDKQSKQGREKDRERDRYRHGADQPGQTDRAEAKDRGPRGFKDAREIVRERQEKKRQKEEQQKSQPGPAAEWGAREDRKEEARRRKESLKERRDKSGSAYPRSHIISLPDVTDVERLENLEREKQRERRLREERERADKQRRKEEERRLQQRGEAEGRQRDKGGRMDRHGNRSTERSADRADRDRSRGNKDQRRQRGDRDRSDIRERDRPRKEEEGKSRAKGPRTPEGESHADDHEESAQSDEEKRPTNEEQAEHEEEEEEDVEEEEEEEEEETAEPASPKANVRSDDEEARGNKTPELEHSGSSGNESESDKSSRSGSDDQERKRPLKSKFDNESDEEEEEEEERVAKKSGSATPTTDDEHKQYIENTPPQSPVELADDLPVYLPAIQGCRSVEEFHCLNRIEEGTFGVVYRARDKKTNEIVALKRLKMEKEKEGFPITALREINTLLKAQHTNIVTVREIVVGSNMDKIYIVMDYVEHDLKSLMETMKSPFLVGEVKTLMKQLLRAVAHLHDNWILHRDLKTSNLLLSHKGILKVGDFGLAREYGSPLKQYTPIVVTLWYRTPELLLGIKEYSKPIDMWSVGCIFAEFLIMKALWPGKSEIDQLHKIFKDLGTPTEKIWEGVNELPGFKKVTFPQHPYNSLRNRFGSMLSDIGFDLLNRLLTYDPKRRIDAKGSLDHKWFEESPLPVDPSMFPTWPARSEQTGRKHISSPKPPSGGKAYAKLLDEEENLQVAGFHMETAVKGASAQGAGFQLKF